MTPGKLLIAQALTESGREMEAVATLADEYKDLPRWAEHIAELRRAAEFARWWANDIRAKES